MWPFKKKKKEEPITDGKFKMGDFVYFRYRGELAFGWIYGIKKDAQGNILYDVQLGGQCPSVIYDLPEDQLREKKQGDR